MNKTKVLGNSAIALYFIIGLEIIIMISPFAGFFYAVLNPFLLVIAKYPSTKWLSAFFLPHMVVPPDDFLKFIRIMGSVLFVSGVVVFVLCALQVYTHKFLKKGAALKGIYSSIRHPQYVALATAGLGLSILWPRFLVVVLWLIMILLYYFLSKDEEKRMLKDYPDTYREYMGKTGMFIPKAIERRLPSLNPVGKVSVFVLISAIIIGGAFSLRYYTVKHLPLWTDSNVSALAIIPDDTMKMEHRMTDILNLEEVKSHLKDGRHYLVYFLPANYIMQGLIANTGVEWKLYKQHHTISMITDWIFHPFRHLTKGHHSANDMSGHSAHTTGDIVRRLIFLRIENVPIAAPSDLFSINARRVPVIMLDIEIHTLSVLDFKEVPQDTGWGAVPTPVF